MITLHAEKYKINLIWQCPVCKECTNTSIDELVEIGVPLCMLDHYPGPTTEIPMEIVSYMISDITDQILSPLKL